MLTIGFSKNKKTMKKRKTRSIWHYLSGAGTLVVSGFLLLSLAPFVSADQYTQQIQALQSQNSQTEQSVSQLQVQASSYQAAVNQLQAEINGLEQNIQTNENEQTQLQAEIQSDDVQIANEKKLLGDDLTAMYADGQTSTIEELATSKSLSAFVDEQAYEQALQNKIQSSLTQITDLENQLKTQEEQVQELITGLTSQQNSLSAAEAQQSSLLSYNQSQQAAYNQQIQANSAQIAQLEAEEIAANNSGVTSTIIQGAACGPTSGPYPNTYPTYLCDVPQDSVLDQWDMFNRECVSYTAWMAANESSVANTLLQAHNFGNATDWPQSAITYGAAYGVTVDDTPSVGAIAIREAIPGYTIDGETDVGHAMYVEAVVDGGSEIIVSQYNEDLNGEFSVQTRSASGLVYIHFPLN